MFYNYKEDESDVKTENTVKFIPLISLLCRNIVVLNASTLLI